MCKSLRIYLCCSTDSGRVCLSEIAVVKRWDEQSSKFVHLWVCVSAYTCAQGCKRMNLCFFGTCSGIVLYIQA